MLLSTFVDFRAHSNAESELFPSPSGFAPLFGGIDLGIWKGREAMQIQPDSGLIQKLKNFFCVIGDFLWLWYEVYIALMFFQ